MNLALLLPDGVGVRNFVYSGFLEEVGSRGDVTVFTSSPDALTSEQPASANGQVVFESLPRSTERPSYRTIRQTLLYAHMHWAGTVSMRHNLSRPVRGSWRNHLLTKTSRRIGRWAATPARMGLLEAALGRAVRTRPDFRAWRRWLGHHRPSVLFVSNQKSPAMVPAVEAARSLGIPTATFVFSWDNLTSKGRIAVPFDHYLVWSDLMGEELRRYYPHVTADQVHVVGTPQFAPYADDGILAARATFFESIGADPTRPLLCYSAAVPDTVPEEPLHVRRLLELVRSGAVDGNPQVLVRPAPTDTDDERWASLGNDFPEMLFRRPLWHRVEGAAWTDCRPSRDDVVFLANLTRHADLNVNIASTMTLDFALHDKPVVNIAFDVVDPPTFGVPLVDYYYRFDHYRPVMDLNAVRVARSPEELAQHVNAYLQDPSLDREGRRRLVDLEVGVAAGRANARVAEVLAQIGA